MPVFKGTTSGSILSLSYDIPSKIISYSIKNKTVGTVNYYIAIVQAGVQTHIRYRSLSANESYAEETDIKMLAGYEILIFTSGSVDYYFSIE